MQRKTFDKSDSNMDQDEKHTRCDLFYQKSLKIDFYNEPIKLLMPGND